MTDLQQTRPQREESGAAVETQKTATEAQQEQVKLTREQISDVNKQVLPTLKRSDDLKELVENHPGLMKFLFKIMDVYFPDLKLGEHFKSALSEAEGGIEQVRPKDLPLKIMQLAEVQSALSKNTNNRAFSLHKVDPNVTNLKVLNFEDDGILKDAEPFLNHTIRNSSQLLLVEGQDQDEKDKVKILNVLLLHKGSKNPVPYTALTNHPSLKGVSVSSILPETRYKRLFPQTGDTA